ncbi:MAG: hypothetical protein AB7O80_09350 [Acetobacteraceae bacterium]
MARIAAIDTTHTAKKMAMPEGIAKFREETSKKADKTVSDRWLRDHVYRSDRSCASDISHCTNAIPAVIQSAPLTVAS